jgi:hypothetical protein
MMGIKATVSSAAKEKASPLPKSLGSTSKVRPMPSVAIGGTSNVDQVSPSSDDNQIEDAVRAQTRVSPLADSPTARAVKS